MIALFPFLKHRWFPTTIPFFFIFLASHFFSYSLFNLLSLPPLSLFPLSPLILIYISSLPISLFMPEIFSFSLAFTPSANHPLIFIHIVSCINFPHTWFWVLWFSLLLHILLQLVMLCLKTIILSVGIIIISFLLFTFHQASYKIICHIYFLNLLLSIYYHSFAHFMLFPCSLPPINWCITTGWHLHVRNKFSISSV